MSQSIGFGSVELISALLRLISTLVQQQSTSSAEPFEIHERRIETLQASIDQYRLQSLHLELDDGSQGKEGWDDQERSSWLRLCE